MMFARLTIEREREKEIEGGRSKFSRTETSKSVVISVNGESSEPNAQIKSAEWRAFNDLPFGFVPALYFWFRVGFSLSVELRVIPNYLNIPHINYIDNVDRFSC